jgi:hypothetical protein
MQRECSAHTLGVLLAGLFQAEQSARKGTEQRRRRRHGSGTYALPSEPPPACLTEPRPAF